MEWVKERIYECEYEEPNYLEVEHRIHFRFRSDGKIYWQSVRSKHHYFGSKDYIDHRFSEFLERPPESIAFTEQEFDDIFEKELKSGKTRNAREVKPEEVQYV